jgi:para-nitrobenzyl esterase
MKPLFRKQTFAVGRHALAVAALACATVVAPGAKAQLIPGPTVTVDSTYGTLTGLYTADLGVQMYRGIPYATAPTWALRWREPQPWSTTSSWKGDATAFGAICPQSVPANTQQLAAGQSEDCLFLNVARPNNASKNLPVMVFIHGGGFNTGSGNLYMQDPVLAEHGVVLVTLNYRLGMLGFLAAKELDEGGQPTSGDYGLEDQRLALQWVQGHIAAFGGNPANVTVFGESAGAFSVCEQLVIEGQQETGLFQKAIIESAACELPMPESPAAHALGETLLGSVAPANSSLAFLQTIPAWELVNATLTNDATLLLSSSQGKLTSASTFLAPMVRGTFLTQQPGYDFANGVGLPSIPILMGHNRDEDNIVMINDPNWPNNTSINEIAALEALAGTAASEAGAIYGTTSGTADLPTYYRAMSDWGGIVGACPELKTYRDARASMSAVYAYEFTDQNNVAAVLANAGDQIIGPDGILSAVMNDDWRQLAHVGAAVPAPVGAFHGTELPYWAASTYINLFDPPEAALANTIVDAWASFAKTGSPGWPPFDGTHAHVLDSSPTAPTTVDVSSEHHCDFWLGPAALDGAYGNVAWLDP